MNAMRHDYLRQVSRTAPAGAPGSMEVGRGKGDIRNLKNRLDAYVAALTATIDSCKDVPEVVRSGWRAWVKAWRSYVDEPDSWWRSKEQWEQGLTYESDLQQWQRTIGAYKACVNGAPMIPIEPPPSGSEWMGTVKVVAIAGAVIAVSLAATYGMKAVIR